MAAEAANLVEIFSSAQGEGPHVGRSTIFVRFGACDLRCAWCDSPHTWKPAAQARLSEPDGTIVEVANPVTLERTLECVEALGVGEHRMLSLTGGEPLLQPEALGALARALEGRGPRRLLETHGLAVDALDRVIDAIDVVSMDWKLASDVRREGRSRREAEDFHDAHADFLRRAIRAPEVYVKVVVTPATRDDELDAMARAIAAVDPQLPLVLQPVTPCGSVREAPEPERLLAWQGRLEALLADVRLIPQTHVPLRLA